jgi:hypothetical protein
MPSTLSRFQPVGEIPLQHSLENRSSRSIERLLDDHGNERPRDDLSNGGRMGIPLFAPTLTAVTPDLFAMNCASQLLGELNLNRLAYVFKLLFNNLFVSASVAPPYLIG